MPRKDKEIVTLDINGRIRIPAEIREKFGFEKGQMFRIVANDENRVICLIPIKAIKAVDETGEEIEITGA